MSASQLSTKMLRAASLRPVSSQLGASRAATVARRYQSNPPGASNRKPGDAQGHTEKVYEKDGTNPNKNLIYIAAAGLAVGGYYAFFMAQPAKAVVKTKQAGEKAQSLGDRAA
ncbi:hypothetical protein V8F20_001357 [Naviculisporaceae sp. PSN 640]